MMVLDTQVKRLLELELVIIVGTENNRLFPLNLDEETID